ncbi:MAG TPA: D-alanyl-D-alanine carboxypeptidase family protein [Xanthobacteraceae bacterium]|nr:D-alanyl-D-alanine carboxypeptidase family protein [Xanthobacteraceae bacterium]
MFSLRSSQLRTAAFAILVSAVSGLASERANAEASILVDIATGKVLQAENATYPWYPASLTKLMTTYTTLRAVRQGRITLDSLFTVSANAAAQAPTKMGFPVGTQVTVDNAIKMLMVKSANDMAVLLAEGVSGSIDNFSTEMNENAQALGMTQTNYVNPNGLPADGQITSARDLAILARALIREFPEYDYYWHLPGIRFGKRVVRNYNTLLGRYPGADGMKTGFICASGFNLVATATRDGRRLVAVVLGAPSSEVRAVKAAHLLEQGFDSAPLSWLTPSLGSVESLTPIDAAPMDLHEEMCGSHRKHPAAEEEEAQETKDAGSDTPYAVFLSSLRPQPKGSLLQTEVNLGEPVVVFTGPPKGQGQNPNAGPQVASAESKPAKLSKPGARGSGPEQSGAPQAAVAKLGTVPWTSLSPTALAASAPSDFSTSPSAPAHAVPLPRARPHLLAEKKPQPR